MLYLGILIGISIPIISIVAWIVIKDNQMHKLYHADDAVSDNDDDVDDNSDLPCPTDGSVCFERCRLYPYCIYM